MLFESLMEAIQDMEHSKWEVEQRIKARARDARNRVPILTDPEFPRIPSRFSAAIQRALAMTGTDFGTSSWKK
jgi:hypothetical protein